MKCRNSIWQWLYEEPRYTSGLLDGFGIGYVETELTARGKEMTGMEGINWYFTIPAHMEESGENVELFTMEYGLTLLN